jgi:hypothetical protein|tara:strand:+ start:917 stop:1249 length:333 start_codon:yes stop_codon:yes gene_type:complete
MKPINYAWVVMKMGAMPPQEGAPAPQPGMGMGMGGQEKPEKPKPLYDQKQQLAIAHRKLAEVRMLAKQIAGGDSDPQTIERIMYDLDELNRIVEEALTGEGPMPEHGGAI